jgi:hypothetical protein
VGFRLANIRALVTSCRIAPWHHPEISADIAGSPEVVGIINSCREGKSGELADTGDRHQLAAGSRCSHQPSDIRIDPAIDVS